MNKILQKLSAFLSSSVICHIGFTSVVNAQFIGETPEFHVDNNTPVPLFVRAERDGRGVIEQELQPGSSFRGYILTIPKKTKRLNYRGIKAYNLMKML